MIILTKRFSFFITSLHTPSLSFSYYSIERNI
uniref:Uncharacterized protein n=1 Tax=Anguilla anguilla TaxID=7936 RepID=A0A0E9VV18_ANGAN